MKLSRQTYLFNENILIKNAFSLVGPYEADGVFKNFYDMTMKDDEWGEKSHERCEIKMQKYVIAQLLKNANLQNKDIDLYLGSDLINQLTITSFAVEDFNIPYFGVYTACASFGEALIIGSLMLKELDRVMCVTSSHFATAERQYRFPLELGTQPTPASQWTVTGCGGVILEKGMEIAPKIRAFTIGKIVDLKCSDVNNMGMAMAPACADTIKEHLNARDQNIDDYDLIISGDLGRLGRDTLSYLCKDSGIYLDDKLNDCGAMIYSKEQKRGQGGSGAGCSSSVFCAYFYKLLKEGSLKRILFIPTGALLSKDSPLQGNTIPGIAHAIEIEV